jgi:hypothetical protein
MQQKISSCVEPLLDEWSSSGDDVHAMMDAKISMIPWKMKYEVDVRMSVHANGAPVMMSMLMETRV